MAISKPARWGAGKHPDNATATEHENKNVKLQVMVAKYIWANARVLHEGIQSAWQHAPNTSLFQGRVGDVDLPNVANSPKEHERKDAGKDSKEADSGEPTSHEVATFVHKEAPPD